MIELFTIFGKGGLVLWCFNEGSLYFKDTINELIGSEILQERSNYTFTRDNVTIKYKMDNEFDMIILVVYQSIIQLAYADKLLNETHMRFRDLYKNVLTDCRFLLSGPKAFSGFSDEFSRIFTTLKESSVNVQPVKPRTFKESDKSKKTVASMIETAADRAAAKAKFAKEQATEKKREEQQAAAAAAAAKQKQQQAQIDEELEQNRIAFMNRMKGKPKKDQSLEPSESGQGKKKSKKARVWDLTGTDKDMEVLDYSAPPPTSAKNGRNGTQREECNSEGAMDLTATDGHNFYAQNVKYVGKLGGELPGICEEDTSLANGDADVDEEADGALKATPFSGSSWFLSFKALVSNKKLTHDDIEPVLEKMEMVLISKNVAVEPAKKICDSVGAKLEGKVIGTFNRVASIVKESMRETLIQLLTPKRRVNILRDVMDAKAQSRPYVIVFCGVNGVGKSTNLAKITFWLNENNHNVLIAAGDTFRAGAVEQLRTHTRHLNALHPQGVQLYEQGYGKDPASLAAAAVQIAKERGIDVVLVDTAGRMQDNEPLMRSLSKLIRVNDPDLVLFVGEALVGNEAVDQLVKFNQALADNSATNDASPRLIDGIVLTKFDTIDDKVGAAVSMTYITGQPIVFVGTGQTYKDLKNLNVTAVVNSLLK